MKVALVYDRVNKFGGAERVLLALRQIWPQAPLFTSVYHPQRAAWAKDFQVRPSFLQKFPLAKTHHQFYPWLMPLAFESFNFDQFEVVISVTSEFAKGVITKPGTRHICYCLTPTRYLWSGYQAYFRSSVSRFFSSPVISYLRFWDQIAAQRPDKYIAISQTVQKRIKKYYGRESEVIYPPLTLTSKVKSSETSEVSFFLQDSEFFLVVSRLVPYKRVDLVIEAFNQLGWPLKIVGVGSEQKSLSRMAKSNIEFLGRLTDRELISYYQNCQALIMPQEEDLGLVSLEAQASGKPVIAFRGGGAKETIEEGKTGILFKEQTVESLIRSLKKFKSLKFNPRDCQRQARKFDVKIFKKQFERFVKLK